MIDVVTGLIVIGLITLTLGMSGYVLLQRGAPLDDPDRYCYCQQCGRCRHQVLMNWTKSRYLCVECCDELLHSS